MRNERLSDRCLFIKFRPWDHILSTDEKNKMTRKIKSIVGDKKPCPLNYVASFAPYIYSEVYKERLNQNSQMVQDILECKTRTARNYGLAMVFVDLIFEEFAEDLRELGLTLEQFQLYMKKELLPSIKPLHLEPEDHIKIITRWLRALLKMTEEWSVSECLNCFRLVNSKKTTPQGRCLAVVNDPSIIRPQDPMTLGDFGALVSKYGGLKSFATLLKRPTSDLEYVTVKENGLLRRCTIVPFSLIKSDVWIALCLSKLNVESFSWISATIISFQGLDLKI